VGIFFLILHRHTFPTTKSTYIHHHSNSTGALDHPSIFTHLELFGKERKKKIKEVGKEIDVYNMHNMKHTHTSKWHLEKRNKPRPVFFPYARLYEFTQGSHAQHRAYYTQQNIIN
jgi:hypothetical protein